MTTSPLWERVSNLTSEDLNFRFECWAGSRVRGSLGALANILLFLSFFLISGERENEERLFCHYIIFLLDSWTWYHCHTSATIPGTQLEQKSSSQGKQLWRLWPVLARAAPSWSDCRIVIRVRQFWNNNLSATIFTDGHCYGALCLQPVLNMETTGFNTHLANVIHRFLKCETATPNIVKI